jgi:Tol biopolymer transport system component/predicted Ser/Thr protein kinase
VSLSPGQKLAHYEIVELIDKGGMGVVYRAQDTKLGRDVAIKVLPEEFAKDKERLERFEREARLLAQLNHANIATLHGLEEHDGQQFLVMELVEGETLAERIRKGPFPVDEAVPLFVQIAEGLEAAHEKGVVHRDLKPSNIKIALGGKPKILDFGLARAMSTEVDTSDVSAETSQSPTLTKGTALGAIMGTASYMSPEQARGKRLDKRTDIWAFGCCLYEAVTGVRAFDGATGTDVLAAVIGQEVVLDGAPDLLRRILRRCLTKDAMLRFRDIGDVRNDLNDVATTPERNHPALKRRARFLAWGTVGAIVGGFVVWAGTSLRSGAPLPSVAYMEIGLAPAKSLRGDTAFGLPRMRAFAISPDGRDLVFSGEHDGVRQLFHRRLDRATATPLQGTDDGESPFFSPNGKSVGFFANGELRTVGLGGMARTIVGAEAFGNDASATRVAPGWLSDTQNFYGGTWTSDGLVVFATVVGGLWAVGQEGGLVEPFTRVDPVETSGHRLPSALPNGDVLLTVVDRPVDAIGQVAVARRGSAELALLTEGSDARFLEAGFIVFVRTGELWAARYELGGRRLASDPVPLSTKVAHAVRTSSPRAHTNSAQFAVSRNGTLVLATGSTFPSEQRSPAWLRRDGTLEPVLEERMHYVAPRLSPNERSIAFGTGDDGAIHVLELNRMTIRDVTTRGSVGLAIWRPDGTSLDFNSLRGGMSSRVSDTSSPTVTLTEANVMHFPAAWSPDGSALLYIVTDPVNGHDIWLRDTSTGNVKPLIDSMANEAFPTLSPDGQLLAYASDESGEYEVFVEPFLGRGSRHQVSREGGRAPVWVDGGNSILYRNGPDFLSVPVQREPVLDVGPATPAFRAPPTVAGASPVRNFDVTRDGESLLVVDRHEVPRHPVERLQYVTGWVQELERLFPTEN